MEPSFPHAVSISLVINVILGIVFCGMYIFVYPGLFYTKKTLHEKEEAFVSTASPVCLSCDYMLPTNYSLYSEVVTTKCGQRLCCYSEDVIGDFILLANGKTQANELGADRLAVLKNWMGVWRNRENAAHLHIDSQTPVTKDYLLRWQKNDSLGTSFISGVSLEGNADYIRISETGRYYIYSFIKVLPGHKTESKNFHVTLQSEPGQKIGNRSVTEDLQNKKFKFGTRDSSVWISIQGIFNLKRGHKISIFVSHESKLLIEKSLPLSKYFGLYKVGE